MTQKHARYGPPDRYLPPPGAGMCISVFAVLTRGGEVLAGIPEPHERWTSEWLSSWLMYSKEELGEIYKETRLPSSYLFEGEHPDEALRRMMRDELGIKRFSASTPKIMSYTSPSDWYRGYSHWDLAFVYRVRTSESLNKKKLPWWRELDFLPTHELKKRNFGWNQDMVRDLGLV